MNGEIFDKLEALARGLLESHNSLAGLLSELPEASKKNCALGHKNLSFAEKSLHYATRYPDTVHAFQDLQAFDTALSAAPSALGGVHNRCILLYFRYDKWEKHKCPRYAEQFANRFWKDGFKPLTGGGNTFLPLFYGGQVEGGRGQQGLLRPRCRVLERQ
jgi:hypothetical protein